MAALAPNMSNDLAKKPDIKAFFKALYASDYNEFKRILESGVDVNSVDKDKYGNTALHYAAYKNKTEIVKLLLSKGANVNAVSINKETPLHLACFYGNKEVIELLLAAGANVNAVRIDGWTPLHVAADIENISITKLLLTAGADITIKNNEGKTAFYYAEEPELKALLDPKIALFKAFSTSKYKEVKRVLESGVDVNSVDEDGNTVLHYAAYNDETEIAELLLSKGANVNAVNREKETPLHMASDEGDKEIVKLLLGAGANVNAVEIDGKTPLHMAVENGHFEIVKLLLGAGANVNAVSKNGTVPLHVAVEDGSMELVKVFLAAGANVNALTKNGHTSLHVAAENDDKEIVNLLLAAGADKTIKSKKGFFAFDYAKKPEIKALLDPYPKWKGFSQTDISLFDTIFDTEPNPATGQIPANDSACCPVCLKYVNRSEACMYMKHNCAALGGFYHKKLYDKYKNPEGLIAWCTICGRICLGHKHYPIQRPEEVPGALLPSGNAFEKDCRVSNNGGGLPEKLARFRRLREFVYELQDEVGTMKEEEAYTQLVEEVWKAPLVRKPQLKKIEQEKKWNIPSELFPSNKRNTNEDSKEAEEENFPNIPWPNKNNPAVQPIKINSGMNAVSLNSDVVVYRFRHRQPDGSIYEHTDDQLIGTAGMTETIEQYTTNFGLENFGMCFAAPECQGHLHPDEVKFLISDDLYQQYKKRFNQRFGKGKVPIAAAVAVGAQGAAAVGGQRGGNGGFFQEATDAVCDMPKKSGGRRKTRRSKRKTNRTHKKKH